MAYLEVLLGLVILIFAGDFLVRGAVALAKKMGVPTLVIGLTIVAFGTSAPELVVAIDAVLIGAPTLALGNVIGSNIANVLLVIGLPALIYPISCASPRMTRNLMIMLAATVIFIFMGIASQGAYTAPQGFILLGLLTLFLVYSALRAKAHPEAVEPLEELDGICETPQSYGFSAMLVIGGVIGLGFGADMLVKGAVVIAREWAISEEVIGLTLVAIGTSLPELVTALVAAFRRHHDVAVGNVIGSNLFNLLAVIGAASIFGDIPIPDSFMRVDMWVMLAASIALLPYCHYKQSVGRYSGIGFLLAYSFYMGFLLQSHNGTTMMMIGAH